jgi:hypothetical protein
MATQDWHVAVEYQHDDRDPAAAPFAMALFVHAMATRDKQSTINSDNMSPAPRLRRSCPAHRFVATQAPLNGKSS